MTRPDDLSTTGASTRSDADPSEVDLLLRLARRWRRLGMEGMEGMGEQSLSPHQERGLLGLARLTRHSEQRDSATAHDAGSQRNSAEAHDAGSQRDSVRRPGPAGVRISHLAHHLGIVPRSATEVADALEGAGLLFRSPDPTDRRAVLLGLTDEGRAAVARVRARRRAAAEEAMSTLSPEDRTGLRRILRQLLND